MRASVAVRHRRRFVSRRLTHRVWWPAASKTFLGAGGSRPRHALAPTEPPYPPHSAPPRPPPFTACASAASAAPPSPRLLRPPSQLPPPPFFFSAGGGGGGGLEHCCRGGVACYPHVMALCHSTPANDSERGGWRRRPRRSSLPPQRTSVPAPTSRPATVSLSPSRPPKLPHPCPVDLGPPL